MHKLKNFLLVNKLFVYLAIFQILLWLVFLPTTYATIDENNYLQNAYKIAHAQSLVETESIRNVGGFPRQLPDKEVYISKYNLGSSLFFALPEALLPELTNSTVLIGLNLLITIATQWVALLIIRKEKLPDWSIILIGLFPIFTYFSRTAFSEVIAAFLFTTSFYLLLTPAKSRLKLVLTGLMLGLLVLVRYNFILWIIFLGISLLKDKLGRSKLAWISIGGLPFFIVFLLINYFLYGGFFSSGYSLSGEQSFDISLLIIRLPQYLIYLNFLYPGMLFLSITNLWRNRKESTLHLPFAALIICTVILYSISGGFLYTASPFSVINGARFFVPMLYVILIYYLQAISKYKFLGQKMVLTIMTISLAILVIALSYTHQRFLLPHADRIEQLAMLQETESALFIVEPEFEIYFGNHVSDGFINDGIVVKQPGELNAVSLNKISQAYKFNKYYLVSATEPATDVLKLSEPFFTNENVKIYEYKN